MAVLIRRSVYISAIAIFLVVAPIVVALTAGYRWAGFDFGFVKTGLIVVESQPKATVLLNGEVQGQTPERIAGLVPGTYVLELRRDGYAGWSQPVSVSANTATLLNPIVLFPENLTEAIWASNWPEVLFDSRQQRVFGLRSNESGTELLELWPSLDEFSVQLAAAPVSVLASPRGQYLAVGFEDHTTIILSNRPETAWEIPVTTDLTWSEDSELIFFGRRNERVIRFDILTSTETVLQPASTFTLAAGQLWFTQQSGFNTTLYRQTPFGQAVPAVAKTLSGTWEIVSGQSQFFLRNQETQETRLLQYDGLTQQLVERPLGNVQSIFWPRASDPPLWQTDVRLMTLDASGPSLVERIPVSLSEARWVDPGHILLVVQPESIAIKSVSQRQGRTTLIEKTLSEYETVLLVDERQKFFLVHSTETEDLHLYRWDEPLAASSQ